MCLASLASLASIFNHKYYQLNVRVGARGYQQDDVGVHCYLEMLLHYQIGIRWSDIF